MNHKRRKRRRHPPGYIHALLGKARKLQPGQVYEVRVYHDAWCPLVNRRGPCRCQPHVTAFRRLDPGAGPSSTTSTST
jgi:hypothetical protein